jgi:2,3-bisphosphoglycerate-dependent phosphoglycerate mutase
MKYILTICTFILLWSCKEKENKFSYDGAYVNAIISDVIRLENGAEIKMDPDSVSKIFYLIRHAEKDTTVQNDPPLTEEGLNRGTRLADLLRGTRVDAIYSTMFLRTLYTVDSLADIKAMKVLPYDNKMLKELIDQLNTDDEVKAILFVGHSNTIPSMTNTLTGKEVFNRTFPDEDYDNFVVVVHYKNGEKIAYPLRFK